MLSLCSLAADAKAAAGKKTSQSCLHATPSMLYSPPITSIYGITGPFLLPAGCAHPISYKRIWARGARTAMNVFVLIQISDFWSHSLLLRISTSPPHQQI